MLDTSFTGGLPPRPPDLSTSALVVQALLGGPPKPPIKLLTSATT